MRPSRLAELEAVTLPTLSLQVEREVVPVPATAVYRPHSKPWLPPGQACFGG